MDFQNPFSPPKKTTAEEIKELELQIKKATLEKELKAIKGNIE